MIKELLGTWNVTFDVGGRFYQMCNTCWICILILRVTFVFYFNFFLESNYIKKKTCYQLGVVEKSSSILLKVSFWLPSPPAGGIISDWGVGVGYMAMRRQWWSNVSFIIRFSLKRWSCSWFDFPPVLLWTWSADCNRVSRGG